MTNEDKQFVEIPTMTFHIPKKKKATNRLLLAGLGIMIAGIIAVILAIVLFL